MIEFYTPSLLITEYYDSLISQIDIYTEETIREYKKQRVLFKPELFYGSVNRRNNEIKTYGVETFNNPYESAMYSIDRNVISEIIENPHVEEYMNKMRQKAIDEIRKVQVKNFEYYKANKEKFKVDRENLTEEKLEELKSQLFANRYCFLVNKEEMYRWEDLNNRNVIKRPLFNLHTVITDFYLRESDIDYIRSEFDETYYKYPLKKLDKTFLLANQVQKYMSEAFVGNSSGYEVIQINQKTLIEIEHIQVQHSEVFRYLRFNETDMSFDNDIYLSAVKSLNLVVAETKISDLSAFFNLEYLSICGADLCQSPFQNLHKLVKLTIIYSDLSEFDFDSLNSLTSLQIIEISINTSVSLKIDLSRLINLKWLDLSFNNKVETTFELSTDDSYNQLTKIVLYNKTFDFSKQLDLPQLKCLYIRRVDLSEQISNQSFNGIYNLIELNLTNTYLTNVDFLNTDRFGNLEILDLSNNEITVLRKGAFSKLKKLKKLNLYNNKIKELVKGIFEGLECLEYLDISSNPFDVKSIDKIYRGFKSIEVLKRRH